MVGELLLQVRDLRTYFIGKDITLKAVDGVDLEIRKGEIVGLLGESGCGKTMTALSIMRLVPYPGRIVGGQIIFDGVDLVKLSEEEMRKIRGRKIAMVFQDPMTSLNPVLTTGFQIGELYMVHENKIPQEALDKASEMMEKVGIPDAKARAVDYPHQFSGGMRQRIVIAMALALKPPLIIADEPTSALDVTTQAQVMELIRELKRETNASLLLITHDFGVAAELCDRIAVMYAGKVVEFADKYKILKEPLHPYTQGLLESLPRGNKNEYQLRPIPGQVPSLTAIPNGCRFHPRCGQAFDKCRSEDPPLIEVEKGHLVRCFLYER